VESFRPLLITESRSGLARIIQIEFAKAMPSFLSFVVIAAAKTASTVEPNLDTKAAVSAPLSGPLHQATQDPPATLAVH
jgi:hypothetical protein